MTSTKETFLSSEKYEYHSTFSSDWDGRWHRRFPGLPLHWGLPVPKFVLTSPQTKENPQATSLQETRHRKVLDKLKRALQSPPGLGLPNSNSFVLPANEANQRRSHHFQTRAGDTPSLTSERSKGSDSRLPGSQEGTITYLFSWLNIGFGILVCDTVRLLVLSTNWFLW